MSWPPTVRLTEHVRAIGGSIVSCRVVGLIAVNARIQLLEGAFAVGESDTGSALWGLTDCLVAGVVS